MLQTSCPVERFKTELKPKRIWTVPGSACRIGLPTSQRIMQVCRLADVKGLYELPTFENFEIKVSILPVGKKIMFETPTTAIRSPNSSATSPGLGWGMAQILPWGILGLFPLSLPSVLWVGGCQGSRDGIKVVRMRDDGQKRTNILLSLLEGKLDLPFYI